MTEPTRVPIRPATHDHDGVSYKAKYLELIGLLYTLADGMDRRASTDCAYDVYEMEAIAAKLRRWSRGEI